MKLATTHLVLGVIESSVRAGRASGFQACTLADPNLANRAISRDITGRTAVRLASDRGDGNAAWHPEGSASALDIQQHYLDIVRKAVTADPDSVSGTLPRTDVPRVLDDWQGLLDLIAANDVAALADRLDWAAKYRLLSALGGHGRRIDPWRAQQLDMDYHDIVNGSVYPALVRRGMMRVLVSELDVGRAVDRPPADTRAAMRGQFVREAMRCGARFSCDWTRLTLSEPVHGEVVMLDPFDAGPSPAFDEVLARLEKSASQT